MTKSLLSFRFTATSLIPELQISQADFDANLSGCIIILGGRAKDKPVPEPVYKPAPAVIAKPGNQIAASPAFDDRMNQTRPRTF
jgi:hypothetical protein